MDATTPSANTAVRAGFRAATAEFRRTVARLDPERLGGDGLGEWTLLELLAHACRAFLTIELALVTPPGDVPFLSTPSAYFLGALDANPQIHAQVAQRARDTVGQLGPDPIAGALEIAERVLALVTSTPDDAVCGLPTARLTLIGYLPTRTVEVVAHTLDLQHVAGLEPSIDPIPLKQVLHTLIEISDRDDPVALLRALIGREPLPATFNVFR